VEESGSANDDTEDAASTDSDTPSVGATDRRLHMGSSADGSRGRRTFIYTPWALVEVHQIGLLENRSVLRCAYEYGSPMASFDHYSSAGAVSGGSSLLERSSAWMLTQGEPAVDAHEVSSMWANSQETNCWVRTFGAPAADGCAVSLREPGLLESRIQRKLIRAQKLIKYSLIAALVLCWPCCMLVLCNLRNDKSSGPYPQYERVDNLGNE